MPYFHSLAFVVVINNALECFRVHGRTMITTPANNESRKLVFFWQKILIEINNVKIIGNHHAPSPAT